MLPSVCLSPAISHGPGHVTMQPAPDIHTEIKHHTYTRTQLDHFIDNSLHGGPAIGPPGQLLSRSSLAPGDLSYLASRFSGKTHTTTAALQRVYLASSYSNVFVNCLIPVVRTHVLSSPSKSSCGKSKASLYNKFI